MSRRRKFGLFLGKKCMLDTTWYIIIDVLLLIMVFLGFTYFVRDTVQNNAFEKIYLSKEQATLISAVYMINGNALSSYSGSIQGYTSAIKNGWLRVSDSGGGYETVYRYAQDKSVLNPEEVELKNAELSVVKNGGSVRVGTGLKINLNAISCPEVRGSTKSPQIIIDPASGKEDKRKTNQDANFYEGEITFEIAQGVKNYLGQENVKLTRVSSDSDATFEQRMNFVEESTGAFIIIGTGSNVDLRKNDIKAYYRAGDEKSKALGCLILNSLTEKLSQVTGAGLIPSNEIALDKNKEGVAVRIELGNVQIPEKDNVLKTNAVVFKTGIGEGIKKYHEMS